MIARIATFPSLPPDVSAEVRRNVLERFMPALRAQDGFVAGYWLAEPRSENSSCAPPRSTWRRSGWRAGATDAGGWAEAMDRLL